MNIFKKFFQNIRKESFQQSKTTSKKIPIHQTFENLNISNELLKNNATQSEFLDHIKVNKLFFTQDWFSYKINVIKNILDKYQKNYPNKILEIGSFEGLSTSFFLYLFNNSKIDVVDLFLPQYKEVFDKNLKIINNGYVKIFKTNSHNIKKLI